MLQSIRRNEVERRMQSRVSRKEMNPFDDHKSKHDTVAIVVTLPPNKYERQAQSIQRTFVSVVKSIK